MKTLNTAGYLFTTLPTDELPILRAQFKEKCLSLNLKGTILLSPEGINLFMAGTVEAVTEFKQFITQNNYFNNLTFKDSYSDEQPFGHLYIKIKKEIIPFANETVQPEKFTAPYLKPQQFKQWLDEGKEVLILDTRNDYEVGLGTFDNATILDLQNFRDFPQAVREQLKEEAKTKTIVTFCTGGIRCEKAAAWMLQSGFQEVYQLEGGILNYFEQCGDAHYHGDCFVFDDRVAVTPQLEPII